MRLSGQVITTVMRMCWVRDMSLCLPVSGSGLRPLDDRLPRDRESAERDAVSLRLAPLGLKKKSREATPSFRRERVKGKNG